MPRTRSDASAYSPWGQESVSRGTSFGWVHGDRHEACHPHTSRFFPVLVLRLRRLNTNILPSSSSVHTSSVRSDPRSAGQPVALTALKLRSIHVNGSLTRLPNATR